MATDDLILVTGASGFVAKHIIKSALERGYRVRGTLRRPEAAGEVRAAVGEPGGRLELVQADLLEDRGWSDAARGCRYVLHVASVFPLVPPKDRNALVPVARDGALRVLRAAAAAGAVRTVLTSSCVAIWAGHRPDGKHVFTEGDWTDVDSPDTDGYALSKTVAERAAWDFAAKEAVGMSLVTVNPSFVLGPPLDRHVEASADFALMLLRGKYPVAPRWGIEFVDVRDVAEAHLRAMGTPEAAGRRFIASSGPLTVMEAARIVGEHFPAYAGKMPRIVVPDIAVRLLALFDRAAAAIVPDLGPVKTASSQAARDTLKMTFRPAEEALVAMTSRLIEMKLV
jgi:dihydroflavonol-4-reductase